MASHKINDLSQTIGDCGTFQVILTSCVHATTVVTVFGMMFMSFGVYNPGWRCNDNYTSMYLTENCLNSTPASCTNNSNSTKLWSMDCSVKRDCQSPLYSDESSTVVTEWDLSCDLAWVPSMVISVQMIGGLLGSFSGGQIGDRYGRKLSMYLHAALHCISHALAAVSSSWEMYLVVNFFIGFFVLGTCITSYSFPLEFANTKWRGVIVSVPVWNIGYALFSLVVFVLRDWRQVHIVAVVFNILVLLSVFWTPESVRWLAVSGKVDKSKKVVAKISRINNRPCPDTNTIDKIAEEEKKKMGEHVYTYLDLFRIPRLRAYSLKVGFIWVTIAYTYYGISFGTQALSGDFYVNLIISAFLEIPGIMFIAPMVNKLGRRLATLILLILEVACSVALVIVFLTASGSLKDISVLILALLCKMVVVAAWGALTVYSAELYPTVVRNLSFGFLYSVSRVGSIVSPYLIPRDPELLYIAFIVIGLVGAISFLLVWTLPETKGMIMMDSAETQSTTHPEEEGML